MPRPIPATRRVGDGTNAASLTATQILQNSLTINAGSTVTIAPSGGASMTAAAGHVRRRRRAASRPPTAAMPAATTSDPFTAIQQAIADGAISSTTGQVLENRIAAIERLAATDPGLDVSLLESRVLVVLPSSSTLAADSSPILDSGSSLLALDSSALGSGSASGRKSRHSLPARASPALRRRSPSRRACCWPQSLPSV